MGAERFGLLALMRLQWRPSLSRNLCSRKRLLCTGRCLSQLPIRLTAAGHELSFVTDRSLAQASALNPRAQFAA